jgi:hypothetical protein
MKPSKLEACSFILLDLAQKGALKPTIIKPKFKINGNKEEASK